MERLKKLLKLIQISLNPLIARMLIIMKSFRSKVGLITVLVMCTIVAVFFAIRPQGDEFIILHRNLAENLKQEANSHVSFALGHANARNEIAQTIISSFDQNSRHRGDVSQAFGSTRFEDILSSNIEVKVEDSPFNFSWGVNFILLIQSLSDKFLSENGSILVVNQFLQTENGDNISMNLTSQGIATRNVPLTGYQNANDFRMSLSQFLTKFVLEKKQNCQTNICGSDLPETHEKLELLVGILDAMVARKSDGVCKNVHKEAACISLVQNKISEIDDSGDVAEFLNFIAAMIDLQGGLLASGATERIGNALDKLEIHMIPLKNSPKFSKVLSDDGNFKALLESLNLEDLELNLDFINSIEFYLSGRKYMHTGKPSLALRDYEKVKGEPSWFRGFKEGVILSTSFDPKTGKVNDLIMFIEKMASTKFKRDHIKNALLGQMVTSLLEERTGDLDDETAIEMQELVLESWGKAIEQAPSLEDKLGAQIEFSRSLFALGLNEDGWEQLEDAVTYLTANIESKKFHMAFFSAAAVFARQEDYRRAEWALRISAKSRPKNVCAAENLEDFNAMRNSLGHKFSEIISELRIQTQPTC